MKVYFRQFMASCTLLIIALSSYCQTSHKPTNDKPIQVLVIPPYDEVASRGISPQVDHLIKGALAEYPEVKMIPFGAKFKRTHWQNIYHRKYLGPILEVSQPDIIIMSKLDLVDQADNMDNATWNLSFRAYNVKTKEQKDLSLKYQGLTHKAIQEKLSHDSALLVSELLRINSSDK